MDLKKSPTKYHPFRTKVRVLIGTNILATVKFSDGAVILIDAWWVVLAKLQ